MRKPVVFMFSGQGSQSFQMGRELYDHHPRFRLWMDLCDRLVGEATGRSLLSVLFEKDRAEVFDDLLFTNPALLSVEFCLATVLQEAGIHPDYLLGYSLGEFTAAVVSGVLTLEEGIELTVDLARLMQAKAVPGGMLAILGNESLPEAYPQAFAEMTVSARNFASNFVVSGTAEKISALQTVLAGLGITTQRLAVRYGFHSPVIEPLKADFLRLAEGFNYLPPRVPLISAVATGPIDHIDELHLWRAIVKPVDFRITIERMINQKACLFMDAGPSGSLATAVKYILPKDSRSGFLQTINPYGRDCEALKKAIMHFQN
ncbi:acyltransferase domain-containing protein [Agrobacterium vitis]|uniref:acyltransferase domain-containing protein n=1 Tax=Agrobacterium vitis TaxID=373 RepID=UPI0015D989DB|nr:acyltransferase domain-containing protein [Agrobacterium vitis]MCF1455658.1 acyltransferase domain-containing protein [Agrobacterium vitis]BCH57149.1 polyketide biosynthesis acyltransferase PksD [Agrobacterium vitis]